MALPGTLLVTVGLAFGGLAVLPAAAEESTATRAPLQLASSPSPSASPVSTGTVAVRPATTRAAARPVPQRDPVVDAALGAGLARGLAATPVSSPKPSPSPSPAAPAYVRPDVGPLSSGFGMRWGRLHAGVDLAGPLGSPIRAVTGGTVVAADQEGGYGLCVRINHPDGTLTVYGHMSALIARAGQQVAAGDIVGLEGSTGHSTGPHLHFEIHVNGAPIDPIPWLAAHGITV